MLLCSFEMAARIIKFHALFDRTKYIVLTHYIHSNNNMYIIHE